MTFTLLPRSLQIIVPAIQGNRKIYTVGSCVNARVFVPLLKTTVVWTSNGCISGDAVEQKCCYGWRVSTYAVVLLCCVMPSACMHAHEQTHTQTHFLWEINLKIKKLCLRKVNSKWVISEETKEEKWEWASSWISKSQSCGYVNISPFWGIHLAHQQPSEYQHIPPQGHTHTHPSSQAAMRPNMCVTHSYSNPITFQPGEGVEMTSHSGIHGSTVRGDLYSCVCECVRVCAWTEEHTKGHEKEHEFHIATFW